MRTLRLLAPLASLALVPALTAAPADMALTSSDGYTLKGTLTLPAAKGKVPVVILAHQFGADRSGWAPLAERLAARGIGTLALDLRGHGASTRKNGVDVAVTGDFMASAKAVGFDQIPADLAQAAAWLRKQPGVDGRRIGLAGSSVGAFSVLLAAPEVKPVAVLSLSAAGTGAFGEGARERLKGATLRGKASTLVLASTGDKDAYETALALKDLPGVALNLKEGDEHGFAYFKARADLMAVFFGEYLTYHHTGKAYATAPKKPATPGNVINDQTVANQKSQPSK
ncbi:MAG: alpha/beta fold hydrolase [Geothrix sp.]|uniref:alpha/beta hydrolase family protein n=1 Tax=Geothrix sp. TaxID=1962974 RepID=UPI0017A624AB|nr:alpha/beta fold hydrolase [Geothrix sp.]NWJ41618.1 alpha/beta fold hydrolase [Geothrix sp.]WIL20400.1 MAG: alpha/beta fold hydrolase [Geothrix sp.]